MEEPTTHKVHKAASVTSQFHNIVQGSSQGNQGLEVVNKKFEFVNPRRGLTSVRSLLTGAASLVLVMHAC